MSSQDYHKHTPDWLKNAIKVGVAAALKEENVRLSNELKKDIETHVKTCPHGQSLLVSKAFIVGACFGSGLLGGVTMWGLISMVFGV